MLFLEYKQYVVRAIRTAGSCYVFRASLPLGFVTVMYILLTRDCCLLFS